MILGFGTATAGLGLTALTVGAVASAVVVVVPSLGASLGLGTTFSAT